MYVLTYRTWCFFVGSQVDLRASGQHVNLMRSSRNRHFQLLAGGHRTASRESGHRRDRGSFVDVGLAA